MRSILSILIGLVLCGSACAEAPTSGMLARYFGPGSTYGASTSVADLSGADFVDTESTSGILAIPGSHLSGKSNSTLEFTFQSTDTQAVILHGQSGAAVWLLAARSGSTSAISSSAGTPAITIDGSPFAGTNQGQLYTAICDGAPHSIAISAIDFTASASWLSNGLKVGGWAATWYFTGTISDLKLDGTLYKQGNTGTLTGGDTLSTLHVGAGNGPGGNLANHGVVLDGSADYLGYPSQTFGGDFTTAGWCKLGASGLARMVGSTAGVDDRVYVSSSTGDITVRIAGSQQTFSTTGVTVGQWFHVAVVRGGSNQVTCYLNGTASSSGAKTLAGTFGGTNAINSWGNHGGFYSPQQSIADALIYNRALSPSEIAQVYAEGVTAETTKYIRLRGIGGKLQTINGSPVGVSQ